MATRAETIAALLDQFKRSDAVTARKMFGEYALYADGKVVALVCDDELFVKPTEKGRAFIGKITEAPAYKGAKPSFLISGDLWEDPDWLRELIRITAAELPTPKPKKKKSKA